MLIIYQLLTLQYKYGLRSCFHRKTQDIVIKLVMGVVVHILCGYVTLPLYALVTQVKKKKKTNFLPFLTLHIEVLIELLFFCNVKEKKKKEEYSWWSFEF